MIPVAYGGLVPDNTEDLEELPGVGYKTAGVVLSQAFGHPAFPIDQLEINGTLSLDELL